MRRPTAVLVMLSTFLLLLGVSCGSDGVTTPPAEFNITPQGGTVSFLGGLVEVSAPAGAVDTNTLVVAALAMSAPAHARLVPQSAVTLSPTTLVFNAPVTVTVHAGDLSLPTGVLPSELRVHKVDGDSWVAVPGSTTGAGETVTAALTSLGTYGLLYLPVNSVALNQTTASIAVGGEVQLTATPRFDGSTSLPSRPVTWSSNSAGVATVVNGLVTGVSAGTATITATSSGQTAQATITVTGGGGEPPAIWLEEDFSTYASTANFLTNPRNIYTSLSAASNGDEVFGRDFISLENTGYGSSTKSLRYNFPDRSAAGNRCNDFSIGVNMKMPSSTTEVWVEVVAQFSPSFATKAPTDWGCVSNPDYKFIFGRVTGTSSRYETVVGNGGNAIINGYPTNEEAQTLSGFGLSSINDGNWHVFRWHWKVAAGTGAAQLWIDGTLRSNLVNISTGSTTAITGLAIGRNLNQGPAAAQSVTIGRVRLWNANPGW